MLMVSLGVAFRPARRRCGAPRFRLETNGRVVDHELHHLAEPIHTVGLAL
jgi:hypothetical protein